MTEYSGNSRRMLKNTVFLYSRLIISIVISLYASRILLAALGISDFGLNAVLTSTVTAFSFLSVSLAGAELRFMTLPLGQSDETGFANAFSASLLLTVLVALVIALLGETVGLWFLINKAVVPPGRLEAATAAYQAVVLCTAVGILKAPFFACLVARENSSAIAVLGIVESIVLLSIALVVQAFDVDKLILLTSLSLAGQILLLILYVAFCLSVYPSCRPRNMPGSEMLKDILGYTLWDTIGCSAITVRQQAVDLLINLIYGTLFNAAFAIASKVEGAIMAFIGNFMTAATPQIMKLHGARKNSEMLRTMNLSCLLSAFLTLFMIVPIFIEADFILSVWLGNYPSSATMMIRVLLIQSLATAVSRPVVSVIHSIGEVKRHNLLSCSVALLVLPVDYMLMRLDVPLWLVLSINIVPVVLQCIMDCFIIRSVIQLDLFHFLTHVYVKSFALGAVILVIGAIPCLAMSEDGILRFLVVVLHSSVSFCLVVYGFLLTESSRQEVWRRILKLLNRPA